MTPRWSRPSTARALRASASCSGACVLELAGPERRVMELELFHGWSVADIATYVGESPAEVARQLAGVHERVRHRSGAIALTAVQP